jgi:hypothetical protein
MECMYYRTVCLISEASAPGRPGLKVASKLLLPMQRMVMEPRVKYLELVSAVVGLSVGLGMMTATVLLGVAALLQ